MTMKAAIARCPSATATAVAQPVKELIVTHNNRLRNIKITEIPQEFFVSGLDGVVLFEEDFVAV